MGLTCRDYYGTFQVTLLGACGLMKRVGLNIFFALAILSFLPISSVYLPVCRPAGPAAINTDVTLDDSNEDDRFCENKTLLKILTLDSPSSLSPQCLSHYCINDTEISCFTSSVTAPDDRIQALRC